MIQMSIIERNFVSRLRENSSFFPHKTFIKERRKKGRKERRKEGREGGRERWRDGRREESGGEGGERREGIEECTFILNKFVLPG